MLCFRCGKDLGFDTSGLCGECRAEREIECAQEAQVRPVQVPRSRVNTHGWSLVGIAALAAAAVCVAAAFKLQARAVPSEEQGLVKITEGERALLYSPSTSETHAGRVITWDRKSGSTSEMGVALALGYLQEEHYQTFKTKYGSGKRCPASFLNSNVTMLLIIPDNPEVGRAISAVSADEGASFELSGDVLEFEGAEIDGQEISSSVSVGRAVLFRPRRMAVDGAVLFSR